MGGYFIKRGEDGGSGTPGISRQVWPWLKSSYN